MKKIIRFLSIMAVVLMTISVFNPIFADPPDPPPLPGGHGNTGDEFVGNAPIDDGLTILLAMGLVYGSVAVIRARRREPVKEAVVD